MTTPLITKLRAGIAAALIVTLLSGCGAWQSVKDTSSDTSHALFTSRVKKMNLVIESSENLNKDERGVSLPVVVHVYQLKDPDAFKAATYAQLLNDTDHLLKADVVNHTDAVLGPKATVTLNTPMASDAQYVGVVAFFRVPKDDAWRLVIPKKQWKRTDPVTVVADGNAMKREP